MQYSKKAFTLAEIMIVLSVIGILTAILLPAAHQITPDENVIKFKKAHNTLYSTVRELVTSDKYYLDGNLSIKSDGTDILGSFSNLGGKKTTDEKLIKYFCTTFADLLNAKEVACSTKKTAEDSYLYTWSIMSSDGALIAGYEDIQKNARKNLDVACADKASEVGAEITLEDDIVIYQTNPAATFGVMWGEFKLFNGPRDLEYHFKPICIDVDGINKGEAPFGYGIRYDGKILNGARANEWLNKSIQGDD